MSEGEVVPQTDPIPNAEQPPLDDKHIMPAVKLMFFSMVGLGWLSVREYIGALPVTDASVLIATAVLASLNLALALLLPSVERFIGAAKAFFSQILALCVLYAYSLAESVAPRGEVRCSDGALHSLAGAYAASFFGGLPFHEAPGALTLAFLLIYLALAAGQVRACTREPREWLADGTGQAILMPVAVHLALLVFRAPLSSPSTGLAGCMLVFATAMCLLMPRLDWFGLVSLDRGAWSEASIQFLLEAACMLLVLILGLSLAGVTGGGMPLPLSLVGAAVLVGEGVSYRWSIEKAQGRLGRAWDDGGIVVPRMHILAGRGMRGKRA